MKLHHKKSILIAMLVLAMRLPATAQVEKVAVRTTGISCGTCAVFSEVYLRQLPSIDKITISRSQEAVMITYKPGASFQPADIRAALKKTEVGAVQIQIGARGRVQDQGGKKFFVAGNDKFLLVPAPNSPKIPVGTKVSIEGIVNDQTKPMELRVMTFKVLQQ
jgi:hypothetical protein